MGTPIFFSSATSQIFHLGSEISFMIKDNSRAYLLRVSVLCCSLLGSSSINIKRTLRLSCGEFIIHMDLIGSSVIGFCIQAA